MALRARHLFFGLMGFSLVAHAQVVESKLRKAVMPLQVVGETPQATLEDELHQMSAQAGVIFAGQVMAVRPHADAGWVEVEFRVDDAIRGCTGQGTYRLREWAGLWAGGKARYRVGQRLLMMLHAPGVSGLSSPVGGQAGMIPIMGSGAAPGPEDRFTVAGEQAVDLRWLQTRVLRSAANGNGLHAQGVKREFVEGPAEVAVNPPAPVNGMEAATLRSVLAMLETWESEAQLANGAQ